MRIIIVDDSKIIRESLLRLLTAIEGISIIEQIADFKDAYTWIFKNDLIGATSDPLILLDIGFPNSSGIDLIKKKVCSLHR
jgi:response regulator of citrate/malate metabolism